MHLGEPGERSASRRWGILSPNILDKNNIKSKSEKTIIQNEGKKQMMSHEIWERKKMKNLRYEPGES